MSVLLRALWPDPGPPPREPGTWADLGEDIAAGLVEHDLGDVVAIGHSFGAVASLVAAVRSPDRIRALCLLDPTMVLAEQIDRIYRLDAHGVRQHRLAVKARERRHEFESEQDAFTYWRPKSLFHDWSDEAVWRYVRCALKPKPDLSGFTLAWPAEWEAHYYEGLYEGSWAELDRLDPSMPVLVIRGATTDTFLPAAVERFRAARPSATIVDVAGHGHLFPQAEAGVTHRIVADWLGGIGNRG